MKQPEYKFIDALIEASTEAYRILGGQVATDLVFRETLKVNWRRVQGDQQYLAWLIDQIGEDGYQTILGRVKGKDEDLAA